MVTGEGVMRLEEEDHGASADQLVLTEGHAQLAKTNCITEAGLDCCEKAEFL